MPKWYTCGDEEVQQRIQRIIEKQYPELHSAEVDVRALMAHAGEGEDAVKLHGYPCYAVVKRVGIKERSQGLGDATIIIDAERYEKLSERRRDALIDHELCHLEVAKDKHGDVKKDEADRPVLKIKLHDWQLGGFAQISQRYGADALEVESVRIASDTWGQLFWNWQDDDAAPPKEKYQGQARRSSREAAA